MKKRIDRRTHSGLSYKRPKPKFTSRCRVQARPQKQLLQSRPLKSRKSEDCGTFNSSNAGSDEALTSKMKYFKGLTKLKFSLNDPLKETKFMKAKHECMLQKQKQDKFRKMNILKRKSLTSKFTTKIAALNQDIKRLECLS